ncbi:MAG: penicillin-binding protein 2 [Verrucomicrobia bacterium]|nr:penicillin-binding protein 2 [Verrucomicrobiota bacterium]
MLALMLPLAVAFVGMGYRLVDVQVLRHESLFREAQSKTHHTELREARRGEIRDRHGNLLATSAFVKTVCANPEFVGRFQNEVASVLAPLLEMDERELREKLKIRTYVNSKGETRIDPYEVLKRKVPIETWNQIQTNMLALTVAGEPDKPSRSEARALSNLRRRAIFAEDYDDQIRIYPNGPLAAHVLGFVGMRDRMSVGGMVQELQGADGVELKLNELLSGLPGWRVVETVPKGELVPFRSQDVEPHPGRNVFLTIDSGLQAIVEAELAFLMREHAPLSASAVIVRPQTGEILAMANCPTFDPNRPGDSKPEERRNRVITDVLEPGSTFKIVPASAGLAEGLVSLDTRIDCEQGHFYFAGRRLKDDHPSGFLTVQEVIAKSSNIGTAKIAIQLGKARLFDYIQKFGFGTATGIPLVGEVVGIVHPPSKWSKLSISRIPIGQGIAVTPLQMVMAMSALANDGVLMQPMLLDRVEDEDGHVVIQYAPQEVRRVVSGATSRSMVTALKAVVSQDGTARRARVEGFSVAGKTGTAQKAIRGGYSHTAFFASFVGFFPADAPELCISVILDEPKKPSYYASVTAAPAFRRIAERASKYLSLQPDLPMERQTALTRNSVRVD